MLVSLPIIASLKTLSLCCCLGNATTIPSVNINQAGFPETLIPCPSVHHQEGTVHHKSKTRMAAYHPYRPMLCTVPNAPFLLSASTSGQIFHNISMTKVGRIRCVKAALDCGTAKLCAWTNVQREHWEGDLAVEGNLPAWLVNSSSITEQVHV